MNILSLVLGIAALVFAVHSVQVKGCLICSTFSGFCCSASLLCQLMEVKRRVDRCDWSALMDTMDAMILAAGILLAVTTLLNALALLRNRKSCC